jgi:3-mercaptopyruvate sulfurtransferase SseA
MRKVLLTATGLACAAALTLLLSACKADDQGHKANSAQANAASSQPAQAKGQAESVRRVKVDELQQMLERGEAVVVDVRTKEQYAQGHIKGAILMPTAEVSNRMGELPRDKQIVFYCA